MSVSQKRQELVGGADAFSDLPAASSRRPPAGSASGEAPKRLSIAEQVANQIMAMIKSGNLESGDRLPTEAQMGIAFGISRPPLREALKALTVMGVLESRQGGRYTVTDLSPSRLVAPFNVMLSVTDYDVNEHFESRAAVDLELVRLCTARATVEERRRILELAVDGRAFHHDPIGFRLLDVEFHRMLNDGAHNRLLSAVAQGLYDLGLDLRRIATDMPGVIEQSVVQHCEVAEAVAAGRAVAAVEAYRRHLEHVRETTIQAMAAMRPQHRGP